MRTPRQEAEAAKEIARMRMKNAVFHADGVRERFGVISPEYRNAHEVLVDARAAFGEACAVLVPLYADIGRLGS